MIKKLSKYGEIEEDIDDYDNSLHEYGIYLINGEFNYQITGEIITWILESNLSKKKKYKNLTLMINSHGGDLNCCFAIIDVMQGSQLPVHTVGIGQISSCGLLAFLAGSKGHRTLTPNTTIMSHEWSGSVDGKAHELLAAQKDFTLTSKKLIELYQRHTGLTLDVIKDKLLPPHDVFLTAEEALELHICDQIKLF